MKILHCTEYGLPDVLRIEDTPVPALEIGQVRIKIYACGINFPDILMIQNKYQFQPPLPFAPGGEVAGVVEEVAEGVKFPKVGDRVLALTGWGGLAESVAVSAKRVFPMPPGMDFLSAATTLYTYGTSYHALKDRAQIKSGETLLVLGAAGGVGLAAVELGKLMGATVIAAASSADKLEVCKEKGADFTINYNTEDLRARIKAITKDHGVDVVYDPVGGNLAELALRSMAWGGRYLVVGFATGDIPKLPFNLPLLKGCSVVGVFWGSFAEREPQKNLLNFSELLHWIQTGEISQHLHRVYSLEEAPQALEDMMERRVKGKAVVKIGEWSETAMPPTPPKPVAVVEKNTGGPLHLQTPAEVKNYVGHSLGTSDWLTVTQAMINDFANATLDHQWIHVDEEKAKAFLPGGKTIAHGYLSLSLISQFIYPLLRIEQAQSSLNYGVNKVRFPAPVPSGSRLRLHARIAEVEDMSNGGVKIMINCTIEMEGLQKPVCVAEIITVVA
jgi:NADPH:quinone reductase-like Zn-dependent oxidoreductase/acyl dehydratase